MTTALTAITTPTPSASSDEAGPVFVGHPRLVGPAAWLGAETSARPGVNADAGTVISEVSDERRRDVSEEAITKGARVQYLPRRGSKVPVRCGHPAHTIGAVYLTRSCQPSPSTYSKMRFVSV